MKCFKLFMLLVLAAGTVLASNTAVELFIPAAASAPGAAGSVWKHDARLYNPNGAAATVTLQYIPRSIYAGDAGTQTVTVAAGEIKVYENVLLNLFGIVTPTAGAFRITSNAPIMAETRIYNAGGAVGTYGQRVAGIPKDQAIKAGSGTDLIYIDNSADFRTNMGLMDASGTGSVVVLTAYDGAGAVAGTPLTVTLGAYEPKQYDGVLAQLGVAGAAGNYRVAIAVTTGSVVPYASQVDNASGDPIFIDGAKCQGGGSTGEGIKSGAYYGYTITVPPTDPDWLVAPFAPLLVDGKLAGFRWLGVTYYGSTYAWPLHADNVYFDPAEYTTLTAGVPFSVEFTLTWTTGSPPTECLDSTYTISGTWDGNGYIYGGEVEYLGVARPGATCKDFKDANGKYYFAWEAGADASAVPAAKVTQKPFTLHAR